MAWGSSPRHGRRRPTAARVSVWFNRFRVGVWPDYFKGVQFSRDPEALNQFFRQMMPTVGTIDFDVYSDAYAALFDKIGPAVFVTHSQGGPAGRQTLLKTKKIKGIVSFEPGGAVPFPEGLVPEEGKILTLSKKTEGVECRWRPSWNTPKSR